MTSLLLNGGRGRGEAVGVRYLFLSSCRISMEVFFFLLLGMVVLERFSVNFKQKVVALIR